jgi:hypothetical protein
MSWFDRWRSRPDSTSDPAERAAQDALLERARALPREIEPGRDLWLGIRHRIEAGEGASTAPARAGRRGGLRVPVWAAAASAALLVATGVGTGLWLAPSPTSLEDPAAVRALAASLRDRDGVADVRTHLLALLAQRRDQLPPELVVTLERNLQEIDRAIAEIHLALEAHPNSPALQFLLAEAYRSEAEMLEQLEWWTGGLGAEARS